jgi:DNA-binding MarR family transcriptional regulator
MRDAVDDALAECGLTWAGYLTLWVSCERRGLSQQALAERVALDRTCVSEELHELEQHELVERGPGVDRRQRLVRATQGGQVWLRQAKLEVEAAERAALLPLDPRERARVCTLLGKAISERRPTFLDFV